jgi:LPS sulfotransferase NodH
MSPPEQGDASRAAGAALGARFIVLATPRSGSTWLVDLLSQLPGTTVHGELFLARRKPREERAMSWRTAEYLDRSLRGHPLFCEAPELGSRPWSVATYLDELYRRSGAVGFKVMYSNFVRYPELWAYVVARRLRVVHLVRTNLLDVVVSEQVRWATHTVHRVAGEPEVAFEPLEIDPADARMQIRRMRARRSAMRFLLRVFRVPHLEVTYEALLRRSDALEGVCNFLSIPWDGRPPRSQLEKLVKRPLSELVRNWDDVKHALDAAGLAASCRDAIDRPGGASSRR